jgi:hypothetical protein
MEKLSAEVLSEVLIRVQDSDIRTLSLVRRSWRSLISENADLQAAILVGQLQGRILVKALSEDPPLVDILYHLPKDFDWDREATEALGLACHKGLLGVVELLLMKGAVVDGGSGSSPLYSSCRRGHIAVAKTLIEHGASVMPEASGIDGARPVFWSALHAACEGGYPDIAKLLLESGADVICADQRWPAPLHVACTFHPDMDVMNTTILSLQEEFATSATRKCFN